MSSNVLVILILRGNGGAGVVPNVTAPDVTGGIDIPVCYRTKPGTSRVELATKMVVDE